MSVGSVFRITLVTGEEYGLVSRYYVPAWMTQYFDGPSTIRFPGGKVEVPDVLVCQLCELPENTDLILCRDLKINHAIGYPAKICINCHYYMRYLEGARWVPKSFLAKMEAGYRPRMYAYYAHDCQER